MRLVVVLAAVSLVVASARSLHAEPSARDVAAEELFRMARVLIAKRQFKEACKKLDASEKLSPAVGTLFSLGECYAAQGRTASSWFAYRTATALATERNDPRRSAAEERAAAMEPQLASIEIRAESSVQIAIDGEPFAPDVLRAPVPIDPGSHRIDATAPGYLPWSDVIDVRSSADVASIVVPQLAPIPDAIAVAKLHARESSKRSLGMMAIDAGLLTAGAGAIFGMQAIVKGADVSRACPTAATSGTCDDSSAVHENNTAKAFADASSVMLPLGAVITAVGAYLLLSSDAKSIHMSAAMSPNGGLLQLRGSW